MPRGLKESRPLIIDIISFVNISNFFRRKYVFVMTFTTTHWDTLDDSLAFKLVCKGKMFLSILMASVTCLCFNMLEEDSIQRTNGKCHLCAL